MSTISGPYKVTAQDRQTHQTLTRKDIGKWYILVNGSFQFVTDETSGRELIRLLREDMQPRPKPSWIYD